MAASSPRKRTTQKPAAKRPATPPVTVPVLDAEPGEGRPPFYVIGDVFHAVTSDGMLMVPLRFKTRLFREVMAAEGDNTELFLLLIDGIGDEEAAAMIDELDIFESAKIAGTYFQAWREKQDATVGEAQRSSI